MAVQKKTAKSVKSTAKAKSAPKTKVANDMENTPVEISAPDIREIESVVEAVPTEIEYDNTKIKELERKIEEAVEPLNEVTEEFGNLDKKNEELAQKMSNPAEARRYVEQQLKDAERLKKKAEKIIGGKEPTMYTSTWNGCSFEY